MAAAFIPLRLPVPKPTPTYDNLTAIHPESVIVNAADIFAVEEFKSLHDEDIKFCRVQSSGGASVYVGLSEEELMNVVMQALNEHMHRQLQFQHQLLQRQEEERRAQQIAMAINDPRRFNG